MKKIICLILSLMLVLGAASAESLTKPAPGEKLGFALLKEIYTEGENSLLSPLSLTLALGMAAEGARGETLAQLLNALGAEDAAHLAEVPQGICDANAVFVQPGLPVEKDYAAALAESYAPEWFEIDAHTPDRVNAWVKAHTDGLIERLMEEAPAGDIVLMLLNAVAMDADWALPFTKESSYPEPFHALNGEIEAEMMHQTEYFAYQERDGVQMIRLPYLQGNLEMWLALPQAGEMEKLLDALAQQGTAYLTEAVQNTEVELTLPKLDFSDSHSLADLLRRLGVTTPFGEDADFSGISPAPLCIDEIIQKARMQLDEEGTKAAAATMVAMYCMALAPGMKPEPVVMKLDRPFVAVVRDGASGAVCFAAVVESPAA